MPATPRFSSFALLLVGALTITACASGDAPSSVSPGSSVPAAEEVASLYPLTLENCGTSVTIDAPPERAVTIKSTSTELMLALGLGDRILGTAFPDGPVPEQWEADAQQIPIISDKAPGQEAVLGLEPDFIFAGWESNLTADTAGERDVLHKLGVATYVSPAACTAPEHQPDKLAFEHIFDQFREVGDIFDVGDAAEALVAEQKNALQEITPVTSGTTALWYSSGPPELPFIGGGIGAPAMILEAIGLENVTADVDDTWSSISWEAIAVMDPDVIVLVDADRNTVETKISVLKENPVTAELDAVQNDRFLTIDFAAAEAGVRTVPATVDLGRQAHALNLN